MDAHGYCELARSTGRSYCCQQSRGGYRVSSRAIMSVRCIVLPRQFEAVGSQAPDHARYKAVAVRSPPHAYMYDCPSEVAPLGANHRATGEVAPLPSARRCCFIWKQLDATCPKHICNKVVQHLRDVAQGHSVPGVDWCGVEGCLRCVMKTTGTTNNALWKRARNIDVSANHPTVE